MSEKQRKETNGSESGSDNAGDEDDKVEHRSDSTKQDTFIDGEQGEKKIDETESSADDVNTDNEDEGEHKNDGTQQDTDDEQGEKKSDESESSWDSNNTHSKNDKSGHKSDGTKKRKETSYDNGQRIPMDDDDIREQSDKKDNQNEEKNMDHSEEEEEEEIDEKGYSLKIFSSIQCSRRTCTTNFVLYQANL